MKKSKQPEGDLSYLSGIGADSPQKEDIKSVIRPLEYRELTGEAGNEEGLVESINTSDGSSEIKKDEFVILERRIKSELPGFDFYIARRQKSDKVFEPETVLVAKRNKEHYVQKLSTEISKQYDILEEQNKLLTSDESNLMSNPGENRETSSGSYFVTQESEHGRGNVIGKGGFSIVRPALLRKKGKFTPEGVAIKETLLERREIEDYASEQEILSLMKKLKEINHGKWNYLANPIDTVEGDKHSGVWELLSSTGGKDFKVEDLRSKFEQGDKIPFEKKLIIIRQLFKALSITSKLGIFHNDVKPANILLTPKEIKLCDFGLVHFSKKMMDSELAKRADSLPENFYGVKPREGFVNGTVCYVHPRIVSPDFPGNKKDNGNPRYDVYSAALTAVQILTDDDGKPDKFVSEKRGIFEFYTNYDRYIKKIIELLRERFEKDVINSSFDKKTADEFVELLEKGLRGGLGMERDRYGFRVDNDELSVGAQKERRIPIEELLPPPSAFVEVLKKMGVKESF